MFLMVVSSSSSGLVQCLIAVTHASVATAKRSLGQLDRDPIRHRPGPVERLVTKTLRRINAARASLKHAVLRLPNCFSPSLSSQGISTAFNPEPPMKHQDSGCDLVARPDDSPGIHRMKQHLRVGRASSHIHASNQTLGAPRDEFEPVLPGSPKTETVLVELIRRRIQHTVEFEHS